MVKTCWNWIGLGLQYLKCLIVSSPEVRGSFHTYLKHFKSSLVLVMSQGAFSYRMKFFSCQDWIMIWSLGFAMAEILRSMDHIQSRNKCLLGGWLWVMNLSVTNKLRELRSCSGAICLFCALDSFPMNPEKKDTKSLYLQCFKDP